MSPNDRVDDRLLSVDRLDDDPNGPGPTSAAPLDVDEDEYEDLGDRGRSYGPAKLMVFTMEYMLKHLDMVRELENALADIENRHRQRMVLDSLITMSHVAHRFLRHDDPDIRDVAETLTVGTAMLIGRMYLKFSAVVRTSS